MVALIADPHAYWVAAPDAFGAGLVEALFYLATDF
jgi:hypothetical protein